ncbi:MAG: bifunctional [glutamine synthetase] adenylyltransferase/[glutamine synthetase]-adenylyl-L-tyrosine phosphorylase [Candidatus Nanopelagicales bacterium]|nr:bifunctional [glutamine synthetase] adenylyltransferase/[glutamine synthetase]-adenylyl-L-tyrosine phosphorylase [Candidatus Nanopelagicales bacterium]
MDSKRMATSRAKLARLGFCELDRATRLLESPALVELLAETGIVDGDSQGDEASDFLTQVAAAADPDQALLLLTRFLEACSDQVRRRITSTLLADRDTLSRLLEVLGMSEALGEFIIGHPEHWAILGDAEALALAPAASKVRAALLQAVGADPQLLEPVADGNTAKILDRLRIGYRTHLLGIAARDLAGLAPMESVASWLSDLADGVLEAALAVARAGLPEGAPDCRFAIIGMGKCGGRELNYVSDVDVIFVAEAVGADELGALKTATDLATGVMRACNSVTAEGSIWEVDPALRPEGKQGALVRTIESHVGYYERWAKTWEFQALLKARPSAGDMELGSRYVDAVAPFVWSAADHDGFVSDVQAMRRRVEEHLPARIAERELKLGPGGLRDVEFSVQLLQLVHGRSDVMLRSSTTLIALEALATWGYVGRDDASTLDDAYRFLRTLEHRLQLYRLRRTHTMPEDERDLRRLGRSLGYRGDPVGELHAQWRKHAREVRRLHEKLFYRPLLQAVARLDAGEARLTPEAAEQRLRALGYRDPAGALRHLEALTSGVSRRAAIQRTLLPVLLGWFANAPNPDAGLLGFRRVSDALGSTHWYLRLLRDESTAAERMAQVLASSKYATELLLRAPENVAMLAEHTELEARPLETLLAEAESAAERHDDPMVAVGAVRSLRRRELFRIAVSELLHVAEIDRAQVALSDVATATVAGALRVAERVVSGGSQLPMRFTVIGMGRFGGRELGLGSDVDVMFVYEPISGADDNAANSAAFAVANELRTLLMAPTNDPPLDVDADLRPEGRQGPLVRSLASYEAYYGRWSSAWEAQALLRARVVSGDNDLGARFLALIDPLRYPDGGIPEMQVREIRSLKARMEAERLPRGADSTLHTKLGRGGLSDVEWVAQLLQMQNACAYPSFRTTETLPVLAAAEHEGLLSATDADALRVAWRFATTVRNAVMLVRDRASDMVPTDLQELAGVGYVIGYPPGASGQLVEDYRRVTRRARQVVDRVFYGEDSLG